MPDIFDIPDDQPDRLTELAEEAVRKDKRIHELQEQIELTGVTILDLIEQKDGAYAERNQLVAALTKVFPSHLTRHKETPGETWDNQWLNVACIHLPAGQATWHIHISELGWFSHLQGIELVCQGYDGYTTEEKYQRLFQLPLRWATGLDFTDGP